MRQRYHFIERHVSNKSMIYTRRLFRCLNDALNLLKNIYFQTSKQVLFQKTSRHAYLQLKTLAHEHAQA